MKIKEITWKNFNSYGNSPQHIKFSETEGNFYLILGSNGAGKSTISDVIKYSLYGKLDNKKKSDIPNRFNGNMMVKIVVEKNPTTIVTVERGLAPGYFRLWVNGVEYDQAGKKNMQDYLEEEILGIPYNVFNNMISLSINDFKSFISMSVHDKRAIIDRLFGLELLTTIKWKVKHQIKLVKDMMERIDSEINVLVRSITNSNQELESLQEKLKEAEATKKEELQAKISRLNEIIVEMEEKLSRLNDKEREIAAEIQTVNEIFSVKRSEMHICEEKLHLYDNQKCPTCSGDLTTDFHMDNKKSLENMREELRYSLSELQETLQQQREKRKRVQDIRVEFSGKKSSALSKLSIFSSELEKVSEGIGDEQYASLQNIINDAETKKGEALKKKTLEENKTNFYKIVEEVFGDKGVKLSAIKRILPLLNLEIKKVLLDLNMDYRVVFNEEFEVDIQHLGFRVTPEQLSTGERKKIDFATLIALIRLMKIRFSGVNLVFLDEIFSSIDSDGIYHILKVLHKNSRELNLNIFVINHSPLPVEIFDWKLEIGKNNGFSQINLERVS
jgi:DNA repair exonuclease SbcCD ATPase subunit